MSTVLTAERLRELLHYDPETGVFTRAVSSKNGRWSAADAHAAYAEAARRLFGEFARAE